MCLAMLAALATLSLPSPRDPLHGLWINRRTLLSHGAAASVLLPLRKAPAAAPAAAGAGVAVYEIASAALDRRSYRGLRLANGLQVLLASDPAAGKAAAAMNVAVGSMSNPEAWQGLAHFCEHMLFLGTASYPDEGDFESYIASNGGSNNAYTDSEETVYFFDVGAGALPGALARFSDFFAAPLFTESATAREVAAIESEHSKNIQSDGWRTEQLLRATRGVSGHPYNGSPHTSRIPATTTGLNPRSIRDSGGTVLGFFTGNRATLRDGGGGARAALLDFYGEYYRADQMDLSLLGPQACAGRKVLPHTVCCRDKEGPQHTHQEYMCCTGHRRAAGSPHLFT